MKTLMLVCLALTASANSLICEKDPRSQVNGDTWLPFAAALSCWVVSCTFCGFLHVYKGTVAHTQYLSVHQLATKGCARVMQNGILTVQHSADKKTILFCISSPAVDDHISTSRYKLHGCVPSNTISAACDQI